MKKDERTGYPVSLSLTTIAATTPLSWASISPTYMSLGDTVEKNILESSEIELVFQQIHLLKQWDSKVIEFLYCDLSFYICESRAQASE